MFQKFKSPVLLMAGLFVLSGQAQDLNDKADAFWKTQTGSYVHSMFPLFSPEKAVKATIDYNVTAFRPHFEAIAQSSGVVAFDYDKKEEQIDSLYKNLEPLLLKEIAYKDTHKVFYHGFSSGMSAYNSLLDELMKIANMKEFKSHHPLHYKTTSQHSIKNVSDFFANERYHKAHVDNVAALSITQNQKIKAFDLSRKLGVGKAPDSSQYARDHLKSVNISLFGGGMDPENPWESSFFFWVASTNVGKLDSFLTERLFREVGLIQPTDSQDQINQLLKIYDDLYQKTMAKASGGLFQILVENEAVDDFGFASWAKGIPYYVDRKDGNFVQRNGKDGFAVPLLKGESKLLKRPSLKDMITLYQKDPHQYMYQFSSDKNKRLQALDRLQARLVINPDFFGQSKRVIINKFYRNPVTQDVEKEYQNTVRQQLLADLAKTSANDKLGKDFAKKTTFGLLNEYIAGKYDDGKELIRRLSKTTLSDFSEILKTVKTSLTTVGKLTDKSIKRLGVLEVFEYGWEKLKSTGHNMKQYFKKWVHFITD